MAAVLGDVLDVVLVHHLLVEDDGISGSSTAGSRKPHLHAAFAGPTASRFLINFLRVATANRAIA